MTCGCNPPEEQHCDPCAPALTTQESIASQLENLTNALFGTFTKTIVNGRAVWSAQCTPYDTGVSCIPRNLGEGTLCYIQRVMDGLGTFTGGIWDAGTSYCKNTLVTDTTQSFAYLSLQNVPAGTLLSNTAYWLKIITSGPGPQGPAGPQGPPGPSGSGSTPTSPARILSSAGTIDNNDGFVAFTPAAPINQTIPQISSLASGKWFDFWTNGAFNVTLTCSGADTIQGSATYVMTTANEAFRLQSVNGNTTWRLL